MKTLLKNCRLIPELTEGFVGEMGHVLIDEEKILEIGKDLWAGEDCQEIDLKGKTLLPGFFDLHCHLYMQDLKDFAWMDKKGETNVFLDSYDFAREYLKQGFTTLRDAGSAYYMSVKLRELRKRERIEAIPDIISSGRALTPTNPSNDEYSTMYQVCDGRQQVQKAARQQFEAGADVIKYMATGCFLDQSGIPGLTIVTEEELETAVEIAAMRGSYVMAHAHGADGIKKALRAGVYTIEHGSFIDDEAIEMLKAEESFLVPTGAIGLACKWEDEESGLSDAISEKSKIYEAREKYCIDNAYRQGLKLGFGSDIDMKTFTENPGMEFRARREWYSFNPLDILLQATKYSAEIAGLLDKKGTIKVGKNSELVAVNGHPEEDIRVMEKLPEYVFFKGIVIKNGN